MSTLYEKRGRRYYPVAERYTYDHLPYGTYIVNIGSSGSSLTRKFEANLSDLAVLLHLQREELGRILLDVSKANEPFELTQKQKKAWEAFVASGGTRYFTLPSIAEIVEKFSALIEKKVAEALGPGWERVMFSSQCDPEGEGWCKVRNVDPAECPCYGPTQEDLEYKEVNGILFARKKEV